MVGAGTAAQLAAKGQSWNRQRRSLLRLLNLAVSALLENSGYLLAVRAHDPAPLETSLTVSGVYLEPVVTVETDPGIGYDGDESAFPQATRLPVIDAGTDAQLAAERLPLNVHEVIELAFEAIAAASIVRHWWWSASRDLAAVLDAAKIDDRVPAVAIETDGGLIVGKSATSGRCQNRRADAIFENRLPAISNNFDKCNFLFELTLKNANRRSVRHR